MTESSTAADSVLDAALQAVDGAATSLRTHLGPGPLVVVFLRHFG